MTDMEPTMQLRWVERPVPWRAPVRLGGIKETEKVLQQFWLVNAPYPDPNRRGSEYIIDGEWRDVPVVEQP